MNDKSPPKPSRPPALALTECKVPTEQLRWRCDPKVFGIKSTRDLPPAEEIIGQERALSALELGVELRSPGYNVFVSGLSGTGRSTAVQRLLKGLSTKCVDVSDKAYVHNFEEPSQPILLQLPRGRMRKFRTDMHQFAGEVRSQLHALFEDEEFVSMRRKLTESFDEEQRQPFDQLAEECRLAGLALVHKKEGSLLRPSLGISIEKQVYPVQSLRTLEKQGKIESERADLLDRRSKELAEKLDRIVLEARRAVRQFETKLEEWDREQAQQAFAASLEELSEKYSDEAVASYLADVEEAVLDHLELFQEAETVEHERALRAFLRRLEVNAILDNSERNDTPVIVESSPTFPNLFGTVEYRVSRGGGVRTDHMQIRAGSLIRADGGYLILAVEDLLNEAAVWQKLKRTLKSEQLEIQARESMLGQIPVVFKPQPVPLRVKVILIGDTHIYSMLHAYDPDFRKSFKIRADFDSQMGRTDENIRKYASFVRRMADDEGLLPFDSEALAAMTEEGARRAEQGDKLSTRFSEIADLARESYHFAVREGCAEVCRDHVASALRAARRRDDLYDSRMTERIEDGSILIASDGERIGQVNGLTVFRSGRYAFGKPARITCSISAGDLGILNVEREVQLSGEIHDKGVLILGGFLRERYGQAHPLSLAASLVFEQSYGGVDGDSASSTELYALLSALADVPIRQGIATTGSVNQKGDIQPIGGVNEKILGFFEVCRSRGLNGKQGVIIPHQNVGDLMLPDEIVEAAKADKFQVYAVQNLDQGIEILTGWAAGALDGQGRYSIDTINGRVSSRLYYLAEIARDFRGGPPEQSGENPDSASGEGPAPGKDGPEPISDSAGEGDQK